MEGGNPDAPGSRLRHPVNSLAHLPCRLVCKSDGKDIVRIYLFFLYQISGPVGKHPGLAAAGSRKDQKRSLRALYGFPLLFI
jgi:hypothetical protein